MPMNAAARRDPSAGEWVRLSILIAALLLVAALAFIGSGMTGTAQGQAERGAGKYRIGATPAETS